ncbi:MAG: hypothetical protein ISS57_07710 [Anaerolineales bacterium]|nr:hypothetical protein [Chloroflexota bacterium]MBL7162477.1 hypothetical protein [Anaerolineales bacterium]
MTDHQANCVHCERTSEQVPLIQMNFQGNHYWICPQHLPIVIHKPQMLVGKLPGVENLKGEEHDHQ